MTFLDESGQPESWTYGDLWSRVTGLAKGLQEQAAPGSRAVLVYAEGARFLEAFFACLAASIVAIPWAPPRGRRIHDMGPLLRKTQPHLVLTSPPWDEPLRAALESSDVTSRLLDSSNPSLQNPWFQRAMNSAWDLSSIEASDLAYLQFTSGSTSDPAGVMISHQNLMANLRTIRDSFDLTEQSISVSWLPHFHDMGLVEGHCQPLYSGFPGFLIPPQLFVKNPLIWPKTISRVRGTHGGGPNFAFDLCAKRREQADPEELRDLDLSCWRTAYNGAEPIREQTLQRFVRAFAPHHFQESSLYPCYGLAEATLMVSGDQVQAPPERWKVDRQALERGEARPWHQDHSQASSTLVSVGFPRQGTRIAVVEEGRELPDRQVGEIWIRSDSVGSGYWDDSQKTAETFHHQTDKDPSPRYLRTGDLGFQHQGHLFVVGRKKEILIIRGRNLYPQDIESIVEQSHPSIESHGVAAVSLEGEMGESVAVVAEIRRHWRNKPLEEIPEKVASRILESLEVECHRIYLVGPRKLPRTTSGKIQRSKVRSWVEKGEVDSIFEWKPRAVSGTKLLRFLNQEFGASTPLDRQTSFFDLGLDSLQRADLAQRIEDHFGLELPADKFFKMNNIEDLLAFLDNSAQ